MGFVHVFNDFLCLFSPPSRNYLGWVLGHWGQADHASQALVHWPTDVTADILPINCVSHNDYWRHLPLYAAINSGCIGAEADVWLLDNELYVGHRRYTLTTGRTLRNLYLNPLLDLLEKQNFKSLQHPEEDDPLDIDLSTSVNGLFDTDPNQTFVLLIDFKSAGPSLWLELISHLSPLRDKEYLTYFNGTEIVVRPITIIASGNAPFDLLTANESYRDVFFDAPLEEMADLSVQWPNSNRAHDPSRCDGKKVLDCHLLEGIAKTDFALSEPESTGGGPYQRSNSYYASTSFHRSIGRIWGSRLSQNQLQLIRGKIQGAHGRGLKVRYWGLPQWPRGLRNHVWHILLREGVDMLNVDDLNSASQVDWRGSI